MGFTMRIYSIVVTILFVIIIGFQAIAYFVEKRDLPKEIATFQDIKGLSNSYKLTYSKNGDLTFSLIKLQSNLPSITHWDYYGSTEVQSYKWIDENTIVIEMKGSTITIVIPKFKVNAKD